MAKLAQRLVHTQKDPDLSRVIIFFKKFQSFTVLKRQNKEKGVWAI